MFEILAAVELLTFHMVDGRAVEINPEQVTQLNHPREEHTHLVDTVKCVIRLTDGTYVSVAETCEEVQRAIQETKP